MLEYEREIVVKVLARYHAERLAQVIARATEACQAVLIAYQELEKAGLNDRTDPVVWVERVREFFFRLGKLEDVLSEREALNGIGEALNALTKGGDDNVKH